MSKKPSMIPQQAPAARQRPRRRQRKALSDGRVQMLVYIQPDAIRELKQAVLNEQADSVSAAVAEAVDIWLAWHQRAGARV